MAAGLSGQQQGPPAPPPPPTLPEDRRRTLTAFRATAMPGRGSEAGEEEDAAGASRWPSPPLEARGEATAGSDWGGGEAVEVLGDTLVAPPSGGDGCGSSGDVRDLPADAAGVKSKACRAAACCCLSWASVMTLVKPSLPPLPATGG